MRLCKDCQHFRGFPVVDTCRAPQLPMDLVHGHHMEYATTCRSDEELCGREAVWFQLKQAERKATSGEVCRALLGVFLPGRKE